MAFTAKFTIKRGAATNPALVVIAAGSAEAQSDTMSLNIDATALSKGDALLMIDALKHKIERSPWPPV